MSTPLGGLCATLQKRARKILSFKLFVTYANTSDSVNEREAGSCKTLRANFLTRVIEASSRYSNRSSCMLTSSARKGALMRSFKKFQRCMESSRHEAPMEASDVVALAPIRRNILDHESKELSLMAMKKATRKKAGRKGGRKGGRKKATKKGRKKGRKKARRGRKKA